MRTFLLLLTLPLLFTLVSCEQEDAVITPEAIDHIFVIGDETSPYNFGYETTKDEILSDGVTLLHQYEFMLLAKDIYRHGYLSGVSNMLAINIMSLDGPVTDFDVQLGSAAEIDPENRVHVFGRYCKNMNFSLGLTDEDETITNGDMSLITNDDGSRTLTINADIGDGRKISGSWTGEFVPAKTGF